MTYFLHLFLTIPGILVIVIVIVIGGAPAATGFVFFYLFHFKRFQNVFVSAKINGYKEYFGRCALRAQLFQRRNWGNSTWLRNSTGMQLKMLMIVFWRWLWNIHITMNWIIINTNEQGVGRLDGHLRTRLSRKFTMSSPTIGPT